MAWSTTSVESLGDSVAVHVGCRRELSRAVRELATRGALYHDKRDHHTGDREVIFVFHLHHRFGEGLIFDDVHSIFAFEDGDGEIATIIVLLVFIGLCRRLLAPPDRYD